MKGYFGNILGTHAPALHVLFYYSAHFSTCKSFSLTVCGSKITQMFFPLKLCLQKLTFTAAKNIKKLIFLIRSQKIGQRKGRHLLPLIKKTLTRPLCGG